MKTPQTNNSIPQLVAHRGYMQLYPENSWMGIKAAMSAGACWVEFDVQMCRDDRFVLLHDSTLRRTANSNKNVFHIPPNEFKNISVHEPDRFGTKYYPLPITTLDSVLRKLSNFPHIKAMVEIKEESLEYWGVVRVMEQLLRQLETSRDRCVLISFSYKALEYARAHSHIEIGWVLHGYDNDHKCQAATLKPNYLICNHDKLPKKLPPWPGPWRWVLYDITSPQTALEWGEMGIDLIETGEIGLMLRDEKLVTRACYHGV
ncbi:MAG: glycerophosphodiester phosphodiesterase family protein [Gammaproteobacteria bacterium]